MHYRPHYWAQAPQVPPQTSALQNKGVKQSVAQVEIGHWRKCVCAYTHMHIKFEMRCDVWEYFNTTHLVATQEAPKAGGQDWVGRISGGGNVNHSE